MSYMFQVYLCYAVLSVPCSLLVTCWEMTDHLCVFVVVLCGVLSPSQIVSCMVWYFVVQIPHFCLPSSLLLRVLSSNSRSSYVLKLELDCTLRSVYEKIKFLLCNFLVNLSLFFKHNHQIVCKW